MFPRRKTGFFFASAGLLALLFSQILSYWIRLLWWQQFFLHLREEQCHIKLRTNGGNNSQHCWPNNVGSCGVLFHVAKSLTGGFKLYATTHNNMQQGVQTDATCGNIQQCQLRPFAHGAWEWRRELEPKWVPQLVLGSLLVTRWTTIGWIFAVPGNSPRSLCESHLVPVSFLFLKWRITLQVN